MGHTRVGANVRVTIQAPLAVNLSGKPIVEQVLVEIPNLLLKVQPNRVAQHRARVFLAGNQPVAFFINAELGPEPAL